MVFFPTAKVANQHPSWKAWSRENRLALKLKGDVAHLGLIVLWAGPPSGDNDVWEKSAERARGPPIDRDGIGLSRVEQTNERRLASPPLKDRGT